MTDTEGTKTFSLSLSPQMLLGLILTVLPVIGGGGYAGVIFFEKMKATIEAVDDYQPYDDSAFKEQIKTFEIELRAIKERQLQTAEAAVRVAERASDAIALARETRAITTGGISEAKAMGNETKSVAESQAREMRAALEAQTREVNARLSALKQDLDSTVAALRSEMALLKRATTNPLSR